MIRTSLTRKLIVVFSGILIAVVALNIIINGLLLSRVHKSRKLDAMENLYYTLNNEYAQGADNDRIIEIVKDTLSNQNIHVFIWDKNDRLVIDSLPLSHEDEWSVPKEEPTQKEGDNRWFGGNRYQDRNFNYRRAEYFIFHVTVDEEHIISNNENFSIISFETFDNPDEETLYLRGFLPEGFKILIQMPLASVTEAVYISNILLFLVGAGMLVVGIFIVAITSKNIAKPVKELSQIAASMQNLDFSRKYKTNRTDEIASLGDSINSLSEKLENTINELYEKNEELIKDNELKSRIDTMRKEFIANASHELKTPVALIQGYAEGLRDNVATDEESRKIYTDVIIEETEKMDHIIRQMLNLMEIDGTEEILCRDKFSLSDLVEDAVSSFDVIIKNKSIDVKTVFDNDTFVYGDYGKIREAVTNFVSNAINHVDENKNIIISVKNTGDKASVSVYNSGVNISAEDIANIWERFYKVDKAHTRAYGGTGLGLSIVRSIIELHRGEYGVKNHPDGVEFYFILNKEKNNEG